MNDGGRRRGSGARSRFPDDARPDAGAPDEAAQGEAAESKRRKADNPEQQARDIVYRLLAARARSRSELRQALMRKGIDEDVADGVLQKFVNAGLVDDASFAEEWVNSRQRAQGLGRKALGFELRRKGIDEHLVEAALSTVDSDAEAERARELVQRKLRSMSSLDHAAKMRRLVGMLARKGYSEGLAFRVVREEIERSGAEAPDPDLETP
ncbi:regulatory protein RecX [Saccharopolyspora hirsuta]|uniref:regulatory protein RecX n=1 Tax=Saccharopolyspora hirsuta TaxID=1837 RepID=UPI00332D9861